MSSHWLSPTLLALASSLYLIGSCGPTTPEVDVAALLADGRASFENFYFYDAKDAFARAAAAAPNDADAAYALARTLLTLHEYEEAIPALGVALSLDPANPRVHEDYVHALVWGGVLRGRRDWLDGALEESADAVGRFPALAPVYENMEFAARETNAFAAWSEILAALEPTVGDSPVFRVHYLSAQLMLARSTEDLQKEAAVLANLRTLLTEAEAAAGVAVGSDEDLAADTYALAHGYALLEETPTSRQWLDRLEKTEPGRRLAASMRHFGFFRLLMEVRDDPDAAWDLLDEWEGRFPTSWNSSDFGRVGVVMQQRLSTLWREMRSRGDVDPAGPSPAVVAQLTDAELAATVMSLTERAGRLGTGGGGGTYVFTARALLGLGPFEEDALRIADNLRSRIDAGESLVYPGTPLAELDERKSNLLAAVEHIRGQALHRMGRIDEAEEALRNAVRLEARADKYSALGEFLVAEGRESEGYEALVAALGWKPMSGWLENEDAVREQAIAILESHGETPTDLESDVAAAEERARVAFRARIVGNKLDEPAPDFALTDLDGNEWRLSELTGKVVVLNYWATWCGPCRAEFPHYSELVADYAGDDQVVFLAISTDANPSDVREFLDAGGYDFTVLYDEGSATDFHVTGIPQHFVIGPTGLIQYRDAGGFPGPERYAREMKWRIEELRVR